MNDTISSVPWFNPRPAQVGGIQYPSPAAGNATGSSSAP